jgi:hypothetical protein
MEEQIGRLLVEGGFIEQSQLGEARAYADENGVSLRNALVSKRFLADETYSTFLSMQMRAPLVDLDQVRVQPDAVALVPADVARQYTALPLAADGETLRVAMDDPGDAEAVDALAHVTGRRVRALLPTRGSVLLLLDRYYGPALAPIAPAPAQHTAGPVLETAEAAAEVVQEVVDTDSIASADKALFEQRLEACRLRLVDLPSERHRLVEGYGRRLFSEDLLRARLADLDREEAALRSETEELEYRLSRLKLTRDQEAAIDALAAQASGWLDHLTADERAVVARLMLERLAEGLAQSDAGPQSISMVA